MKSCVNWKPPQMRPTISRPAGLEVKKRRSVTNEQKNSVIWWSGFTVKQWSPLFSWYTGWLIIRINTINVKLKLTWCDRRQQSAAATMPVDVYVMLSVAVWESHIDGSLFQNLKAFKGWIWNRKAFKAHNFSTARRPKILKEFLCYTLRQSFKMQCSMVHLHGKYIWM